MGRPNHSACEFLTVAGRRGRRERIRSRLPGGRRDWALVARHRKIGKGNPWPPPGCGHASRCGLTELEAELSPKDKVAWVDANFVAISALHRLRLLWVT